MAKGIALQLGWRYSFGVARERLLSFLARVSSAGLALGVALLILVLSVMNGFQRELEERILNLVPQAVVGSYFGLSDWRDLHAQVNQFPGVVASAPFTKVQAMLSAHNVVVPILGFGIDPVLERQVSDLAHFAPRVETALTDQDALIVGEGVAQALSLSVGDSVMMIVPSRDKRRLPTLRKLHVADVFATATEVDNNLVIMPLATANHLRGMAGPEGLRLKVEDLFEARRLAWEIQQQIPSFEYATDWSNSHGNLYRAVHMSRNIVTLLLLVIVLVAVFNVVSALVMGVRDKEGEIAILRTMGLSRGAIMRAFIVQGAVIGAVGVMLGVVLGLLLSASAPYVVSSLETLFNTRFLDPAIYPIAYLPSDIRFSNVVAVATLSMFICLIATLIPAWRAARLQPAMVLRGE
ncbi:MAG TPA: lipoprotein-releasing ABC transporter permease subunit [Pseudomonadales bacterium]|nr:lipoprotein-releasing ABC transporter permease subunit [Pseudomonadales bacterium]